jgi:mono/diheme cytochrome c family protein
VQAPTGITGGKATYYKYRCDACHGDTGVGSCDLRKASEKYPTTELMTAFIRSPRSVVPGSHMPPWEGVMKEDEVRAVAEYTKTLSAH